MVLVFQYSVTVVVDDGFARAVRIEVVVVFPTSVVVTASGVDVSVQVSVQPSTVVVTVVSGLTEPSTIRVSVMLLWLVYVSLYAFEMA